MTALLKVDRNRISTPQAGPWMSSTVNAGLLPIEKRPPNTLTDPMGVIGSEVTLPEPAADGHSNMGWSARHFLEPSPGSAGFYIPISGG
jgi:hypothetical protein